MESRRRLFRLRMRAVDPALTRFVASVLASLLLLASGASVWRTRSERREQLRQAESTLATFAEWRRRYRPAVAAESVSWRRTILELQALGVVGDERLAMTRYVARAAEEAGLRDVRVTIAEPDTTFAAARPSIEGVRRRPASFSLSVECRGSLRAVVGFLGQLPPSVSASHLSLLHQDGRARHRLALAVYELSFTNGSSPGWSPAGSDHSGHGGSNSGGS